MWYSDKSADIFLFHTQKTKNVFPWHLLHPVTVGHGGWLHKKLAIHAFWSQLLFYIHKLALCFWKGTFTATWWMHVPTVVKKFVHVDNKLLTCSKFFICPHTMTPNLHKTAHTYLNSSVSVIQWKMSQSTSLHCTHTQTHIHAHTRAGGCVCFQLMRHFGVALRLCFRGAEPDEGEILNHTKWSFIK